MKLFAALTSTALVLLPTFTSAVQLQYDTAYDNPDGQMTTVACSDGANGLITRFGFHTFKDIPNFPHIGAAAAVTSWNSTGCGTCWNITYTNPQKQSKSITVLAIDVAGTGFNVAQEAMDELTGGNAVAFGRVDVAAAQVDASACGL